MVVGVFVCYGWFIVVGDDGCFFGFGFGVVVYDFLFVFG